MRDIPNETELGDWVYEAIALNIQDMCAINDQFSTITKFTSSARPAISFSDYQKRIVKDNQCDECDDPAIHIIALIYLDRMTQLTDSKFFVNSLSMHRAYLACVLVATKFFSEHLHNNTAYAKLGGLQTKMEAVSNRDKAEEKEIEVSSEMNALEAVSNHDKAKEKKIEVSSEMNALEAEALDLLEWDLNVDIETFTAYANALKIRYDQAHISSPETSTADVICSTHIPKNSLSAQLSNLSVTDLAHGSKQQQGLSQDSKPSPPSFLFKPTDQTENQVDTHGDQPMRVPTQNA